MENKDTPPPNTLPVSMLGTSQAASALALRQSAEATFRGKAELSFEELKAMPPEAMRQTLHELGVHQIELEVQNEELRRTRVELEESRARYFDLYDLAPVGYVTISERGLILETNLTAVSLLGVVRSALVQQPLSRFIQKEDSNVLYRIQERIFETGEPQACDVRMVKSDGTPFWAHLTATIAQEAGGAPLCLVTLSNITERKQMNETLRESERNYRDLFDQANEGLFIMTLDGHLSEINQAFAEMHGHQLDELKNTDIRLLDVLRERTLQDRADILRRVQAGEVVRFEVEHYHKDGHIFPLGVTLSLINLGGQSVYLAFHQDLTARRQATEMLRSSLEEKTAMLREIHHRVKNSLQIVVSLLRLQTNRTESPEARTALRDVESRIFSMALLHEVLYRSASLSRIDFADYVKELCSHLLSPLGVAASRVQLDHQVDCRSLLLDQSVSCGLIITELVSNALKHAFPGDRAGRVLVELRETEERQVVLRVSDNGIGLPASFDPAQASTLGLRLIANLTQQLVGKCVFEKPASGGIAIQVTFPRADR